MDDAKEDKYLPLFRSKMEAEGLAPIVYNCFAHYYRKILKGETGVIPDRAITAPSSDEIGDARQIGSHAESGKALLSKAVMIRLNGGLGTSMGLTGPKSLLPVNTGRSFLDLIVAQAQHSRVRLCLMNSFSTQNDTAAALAKIKPQPQPLLFIQNKFPKIDQESLGPARWPSDPALEWNPPGHGDVYTALYTSGVLEQLLQQGLRYAFIANSDNLGAVMDTALLGYFADRAYPFMMEVAEKTPADIKGGHLARLRNGRLVLRESAQCPADELDSFQDIDKYRYFNTNNIWIDLAYLKKLITRQGAVYLPMIVNPKTVDPRDDNSPKVFQLETAMGAAISLFEGAAAIRVPRARFMPVKTCADLMAVRSDCYMYTEGFRLIKNPRRVLENIKIVLDPRYYKKVDDFDARFAHGIPSLLECEALEIAGDVVFEADVKITGRVHIRNNSSHQARIARSSHIAQDIDFAS